MIMFGLRRLGIKFVINPSRCIDRAYLEAQDRDGYFSFFRIQRFCDHRETIDFGLRPLGGTQ